MVAPFFMTIIESIDANTSRLNNETKTNNNIDAPAQYTFSTLVNDYQKLICFEMLRVVLTTLRTMESDFMDLLYYDAFFTSVSTLHLLGRTHCLPCSNRPEAAPQSRAPYRKLMPNNQIANKPDITQCTTWNG